MATHIFSERDTNEGLTSILHPTMGMRTNGSNILYYPEDLRINMLIGTAAQAYKKSMNGEPCSVFELRLADIYQNMRKKLGVSLIDAGLEPKVVQAISGSSPDNSHHEASEKPFRFNNSILESSIMKLADSGQAQTVTKTVLEAAREIELYMFPKSLDRRILKNISNATWLPQRLLEKIIVIGMSSAGDKIDGEVLRKEDTDRALHLMGKVGGKLVLNAMQAVQKANVKKWLDEQGDQKLGIRGLRLSSFTGVFLIAGFGALALLLNNYWFLIGVGASAIYSVAQSRTEYYIQRAYQDEFIEKPASPFMWTENGRINRRQDIFDNLPWLIKLFAMLHERTHLATSRIVNIFFFYLGRRGKRFVSEIIAYFLFPIVGLLGYKVNVVKWYMQEVDTEIPFIPFEKRHIVIPDTHATQPAELKRILISSGFINSEGKIIARNAVLVFMGDNIDRGDASLELYKYIRELQERVKETAHSHGCEVVRLLGNHEMMFFEGMGGDEQSLGNWLYNKGLSGNERAKELVARIHAGEDVLNEIRNNEKYADWMELFRYINDDIEKENVRAAYASNNVLFVHGGFRKLNKKELKAGMVDIDQSNGAEGVATALNQYVQDYLWFTKGFKRWHEVKDNCYHLNRVLWDRYGDNIDGEGIDFLQVVGHMPNRGMRSNKRVINTDISLYKGFLGFLEMEGNSIRSNELDTGIDDFEYDLMVTLSALCSREQRKDLGTLDEESMEKYVHEACSLFLAGLGVIEEDIARDIYTRVVHLAIHVRYSVGSDLEKGINHLQNLLQTIIIIPKLAEILMDPADGVSYDHLAKYVEEELSRVKVQTSLPQNVERKITKMISNKVTNIQLDWDEYREFLEKVRIACENIHKERKAPKTSTLGRIFLTYGGSFYLSVVFLSSLINIYDRIVNYASTAASSQYVQASLGSGIKRAYESLTSGTGHSWEGLIFALIILLSVSLLSLSFQHPKKDRVEASDDEQGGDKLAPVESIPEEEAQPKFWLKNFIDMLVKIIPYFKMPFAYRKMPKYHREIVEDLTNLVSKQDTEDFCITDTNVPGEVLVASRKRPGIERRIDGIMAEVTGYHFERTNKYQIDAVDKNNRRITVVILGYTTRDQQPLSFDMAWSNLRPSDKNYRGSATIPNHITSGILSKLIDNPYEVPLSVLITEMPKGISDKSLNDIIRTAYDKVSESIELLGEDINLVEPALETLKTMRDMSMPTAHEGLKCLRFLADTANKRLKEYEKLAREREDQVNILMNEREQLLDDVQNERLTESELTEKNERIEIINEKIITTRKRLYDVKIFDNLIRQFWYYISNPDADYDSYMKATLGISAADELKKNTPIILFVDPLTPDQVAYITDKYNVQAFVT